MPTRTITKKSILQDLGQKLVEPTDEELAKTEAKQAKKRSARRKVAENEHKQRKQATQEVCERIAKDFARVFPKVEVKVKPITSLLGPGLNLHHEGHGFFQVSDLIVMRIKPRGKKRAFTYSLVGYAKQVFSSSRQLSYINVGCASQLSKTEILEIVCARDTIFDCETILRMRNDEALTEIRRDQDHQ